MAAFNPTEQTALLSEIRKSIAGKASCAPVSLSSEEFGEWRQHHAGFFLHSGYLSIWGGIEAPPGTGEVVIEKKRTRKGAKPYLIFRDAQAFQGYCREARLLGAAAFMLLMKDVLPLIEAKARSYGVPASACDELQAELEKCVGLNFTADASAASDEELRGSLMNYLKRALPQKAAVVFLKHGVEVDIDLPEWEKTMPGVDSAEDVYISCANPGGADGVDRSRLLGKIIDKIGELASPEGTKFDMKDCLLGRVTESGPATREFLSSYYADLKERRSVWRPIAFSYQVSYAHDRGREYLKNPAFIRACADKSLGDMMEGQIQAGKNAHFPQAALGGMYALYDRAREEKLQDAALIACAENAEQIGKALSKELRTQEAAASLARALLVFGLEKEEIPGSWDQKGEAYHE